MRLRGQNAVEFLSVYSFALVILTIAIALVLIVSSSATSTIPQGCSFFGGFSCTDVVYATNGAGSQIFLEASFASPGEVNISTFQVTIDSMASTNGVCVPNVASEGEEVYCSASFSFLPKVGSAYTGTFSISANYCTGSASVLYNYTCPASGNYVYTGNLQLQAEAQSLPQGPYYYVPITATNSNATTATQSGLQIMVEFKPSAFSSHEKSNLSNIRFYDGADELYSWCESNCTSSSTSNALFWVKMDRPIAASGSVPLTLYFLPSNIGYDCNYAGESALQGNTYAACDNGAQVFDFYDNFAGDALNTSLWNSQCRFPNSPCTVNNGVVVAPGTNGTGAAIYSKSSFGQGVLDFYWNAPGSTSYEGNNCIGAVGLANASNPDINSALAGFECGVLGMQVSNSKGEVSRASISWTGNYIYSISLPSSTPGSVSVSVNYSSSASLDTNMPSLPQPIILIMQPGVLFGSRAARSRSNM